MSSLGRTIAGVFVLVGVGSFVWFGPSLFSYRGGRRGGHRELQDLGYLDYLQIKQEVKEAGSYQAWLKKMAIERQRRREELRQGGATAQAAGAQQQQAAAAGRKGDYSLTDYILAAFIASMVGLAFQRGVIRFDTP